MNDRFKFKIWNNVAKCFVESFNEPVATFTFLSLSEYLHSNSISNIDNFTFLQFTGLTDINGKEVYEGDILAKRNVDYSDTFYKVEYSTNELAYVCRTVDDYFAYLSDFKFKVVGNIYEPICNPDHNGECLVCDEFPSECPIYKFKNCKECGINNYE